MGSFVNDVPRLVVDARAPEGSGLGGRNGLKAYLDCLENGGRGTALPAATCSGAPNAASSVVVCPPGRGKAMLLLDWHVRLSGGAPSVRRSEFTRLSHATSTSLTRSGCPVHSLRSTDATGRRREAAYRRWSWPLS
jgi:hypothetical protein